MLRIRQLTAELIVNPLLQGILLCVFMFCWFGVLSGGRGGKDAAVLKKMDKWRKQLSGDIFFFNLLNNSILLSLGIVNETMPFKCKTRQVQLRLNSALVGCLDCLFLLLLSHQHLKAI